MKKITYLGAALLAVLSARAQYHHSFEGSTDMPAGFTVLNENGGDGWIVKQFGQAYDGTHVASIQWDADQHNDYLVLPEITVTAGVSNRLKFQIRSESSTFIEQYEVLLSTTGRTAADFTTTLTSVVDASANWEPKEYDLSDYEGQTVHVAIRARSTDEYYLLVDDVRNDAVPDCPVGLLAADITLNELTPTTASFTFPELGEVIAYHVTLQTPDGTEEFVLDTNVLELSELTSLTTYSFTVQTECEAGMGDISPVVTFRTLCDLVISEIGNLQGNEGTTGDQLDPCWSTEATVGTVTWQGTGVDGNELSGNPAEGTRSFSKPYTNSDALLFSPPYNLSAMGEEAYKLKLHFFHRQTQGGDNDQYTVYANTSNSIDGAVEIYSAAFKRADDPNGWYMHEFSVPASFSEQESVYFIIKASTNGGFSSYGMGMDAFTILADNGCERPTEIAVSDITVDSATISWASDEGSFEYYLSTSSNAPTSSDTVVAHDGLTLDLADLSDSSLYYIWVRTVCADGAKSDWTSATSFRTSCAEIAEIDVVLGNEGTVDAEVDSCWSTIQESGTVNWEGANSGENELDEDTDEGTRVFSKPYTNSVASLVSPQYNLSAIGLETYEVSMNLYRRSSQGGANDRYEILVNTSNTLTDAVSLGQVLAVDASLTDGWYGSTFQIPVEFATSESVYFIVRGITSAGFSSYGLGMDAFVVSEGEDLGLNDVSVNRLVVYPNPVQDVLTIQNETAMDQVTVYNMLGQTVLNHKVGHVNETQVQLGHLANGTYFVKVSAAGATRTMKVVKQ